MQLLVRFLFFTILVKKNEFYFKNNYLLPATVKNVINAFNANITDNNSKHT